MARLAGISKALYFPTQARILDEIAALPLAEKGRSGVILDPCAGEGAAAVLARAWGMVPYGVELDDGRAATAHAAFKALGGACLSGSIHQLHVTGDADCLLLNPPYEGTGRTERESNATEARRQEIHFLRIAIKWLRINGLLIYVVPVHVAKSHEFAQVARHYLTGIRIFRYPKPEYDEFKQCVVLAQRSRGSGGWIDSIQAWPRPGQCSNETWGPYALGGTAIDDRYWDWTVPEADRVAIPFTAKLVGQAPESYVPAPGEGAWKHLIESTRPLSAETERPLRPLREGHMAMLLAAGCLDGTEITEENGTRVLVKGASTKVIVRRTDEEAEKTYETERFSSRLATLNLTDGTVSALSLDENPDAVKAWFERHGSALAEAVRTRFPPRVTDLDVEQIAIPVRAPGLLPGCSFPVFLFCQRAAAVATTKAWQLGKSACISGEMGCGKTAVSIAAVVLRARDAGGKWIVQCPSHLVKKWLREIRIMTGAPGMTAKKISEVDTFFASDCCFLVLGKEMAKLGARWRAAFVRTKTRHEVDQEYTATEPGTDWYGRVIEREVTRTRRVKRETTELRCPRCGKAASRGVVEDMPLLYHEKELAEDKMRCANHLVDGHGRTQTCGEALWSSRALTDKGTKRWPLASYINRRYRRQYGFIADECHQIASADSDQARAAQKLTSTAGRILYMTGTLYGGRASSIFHLLYKISHEFRRVYGYKDADQFVKTYGLLERVLDEKESTSTYGTRRGNSGGRLREIPGAHPGMIRLLLPFTTFIRLADLGLALPPFTETVEILEPDEAIATASGEYLDALRPVLRQYPQILGQYFMAGLGWPDRPDLEEIISVKHWDGREEELARLPALADVSQAKDDRVVEICQAELALGRKCAVYFTQTDKRDPQPRIAARLRAAGLRVEILRGNVAPDAREDWLREREDSFDVLLLNGRLVETGLDLYWAVTMIQMSCEFSIHSLRQYTRRSWRLGQTREVKVIYLGYAQTLQAPAMDLIAKKMRAAELIDGSEAGGLAQHDAGGGDFFLTLAREAVKGAAEERVLRRAGRYR